MFYLSGLASASYFVQYYDLPTNLKFNEYGRPQLNYRFYLSASCVSSGVDGNNYCFAVITYNQATTPAMFNAQILSSNNVTNWGFSTYWDNIGHNYIKIYVKSSAELDYLNVNIS